MALAPGLVAAWLAAMLASGAAFLALTGGAGDVGDQVAGVLLTLGAQAAGLVLAGLACWALRRWWTAAALLLSALFWMAVAGLWPSLRPM